MPNNPLLDRISNLVGRPKALSNSYTVTENDRFELDVMINSPEFHSFGAYIVLPDCIKFAMNGDAMIYSDGDLFAGKQADVGIRRQSNPQKAYVSKALHAGEAGEAGTKKVVTISLLAAGAGEGQIFLEDVKTRKYGSAPGELVEVPTESSGISIVFQAQSVHVATVSVVLRKI